MDDRPLPYRLNRVPDRNYLKFDLDGVQLFPADRRPGGDVVPALRPPGGRGPLPERHPGVDPAHRHRAGDHLRHRGRPHRGPGGVEFVGSMVEPDQPATTPRTWAWGARSPASLTGPRSATPYVGLDRPAPANLLLLEITCEVIRRARDRPARPAAGVGGLGRSRWARCDLSATPPVLQDSPACSSCTCPPSTPCSTVSGRSAAWVRCRVVEAEAAPPTARPRACSTAPPRPSAATSTRSTGRRSATRSSAPPRASRARRSCSSTPWSCWTPRRSWSRPP